MIFATIKHVPMNLRSEEQILKPVKTQSCPRLRHQSPPMYPRIKRVHVAPSQPEWPPSAPLSHTKGKLFILDQKDDWLHMDFEAQFSELPKTPSVQRPS